jgi:hypothetical protein
LQGHLRRAARGLTTTSCVVLQGCRTHARARFNCWLSVPLAPRPLRVARPSSPPPPHPAEKRPPPARRPRAVSQLFSVAPLLSFTPPQPPPSSPRVRARVSGSCLVRATRKGAGSHEGKQVRAARAWGIGKGAPRRRTRRMDTRAAHTHSGGRKEGRGGPWGVHGHQVRQQRRERTSNVGSPLGKDRLVDKVRGHTRTRGRQYILRVGKDGGRGVASQRKCCLSRLRLVGSG